MVFLQAAILVLGASGVLARVTGPEKRAEVGTVRYCPGSTTICFSEFSTPSSDIRYRIAIPDVSSAPFDILLQIVAPVSTTGWAGLAWGGSMVKNPLTIGWASGSGAVVSSRWATGHTLPQAYTGATYTLLPTSTTNATHWQLDVLCTGCSQWEGSSLNPNGANSFAWAKGSKAITTIASNTSTFAYHDDKGVFSHDLSLGKIPKGVFDALAYNVGAISSTSGATSSTSVVVSSGASSTTVKTSVHRLNSDDQVSANRRNQRHDPGKAHVHDPNSDAQRDHSPNDDDASVQAHYNGCKQSNHNPDLDMAIRCAFDN